MGLILLIVLVLFLVGGLPNWGYHSYGFKPSGIPVWCCWSLLFCS